MRIHRLEICGIGPFRDRQIIDFEALGASGLFLIDGPTAAGKTTIIDSITYALFSTLSGEESAKDRMRSDYSAGPDRSEIILDFSVKGVRHTITRGIPYSFTKKNGSGETKRAATQSLIRFDSNGEQNLAYTQANEIGTYLADLLNLNAQKFRQLVVLAQGEFAALLRMNPTDRLKALRDLLGDNYYQKLQSELDERGKAAVAKVNQARVGTRDTAVQIQGLLSDTDPQELLDRVHELVEAKTTNPASVTSEVIAYFEQGHVLAQDSLQKMREICHPLEIQFNKLEQTKLKLDEFVKASESAVLAQSVLNPSELDLSIERIPAVISETRERIGQLKPLVDWQSGEAQRESDRTKLVEELDRWTLELTELNESLEEYPRIQTILEREIAQSSQAAVAGVELEKQVRAEEEIGLQLEECSELEVAITKSHGILQDEKSLLEIHEHDVTKAELVLSQAMRSQLTQRVAVLAGQLHKGEPCSVCGSVEHPAPADMPVGVKPVTELHIEECEGDVVAAKIVRDSQKLLVQDLTLALEESKLSLAALSATCSGFSPQTVSEELQRLSLELVTQRELADQMHTREEELAQAKLDFEKRKVAVENSAKEAANTSAALIKFDAELENKEQEMSRLVEPGKNAGEELAELVAKTSRLGEWLEVSRNLEKVAHSLSPEIKNLNSVEFEESLVRLEGELQAAQVELENAEALQTLAENALKAAIRLVAKFERESKGVEKLLVEVNDAVTLGGLVSASSSINTKKLTLESYALQLRFAHVLESASLHLRKMSSGRLSFILDESAQGVGKTGLGINIMDESTGYPRPTKSLSGGETFYASLSLALGLADVVQSETGGVALETLFVDEGFGSLDSDTLERVLDQLDQLKSGGRTIGVISHVSEMKDRFPDRIVVSRETDGPSQITHG